MGYWVSLSRPDGSEAATVEQLRRVLNATPWLKLATECDPERKDEWFLPTGFIMLLSGPDKSGHDPGPRLSCRLSWGEENMREVLTSLLDLADSLGMEVDDGHGPITRGAVDAAAQKFERVAENIVGLVGRIETAPDKK